MISTFIRYISMDKLISKVLIFTISLLVTFSCNKDEPGHKEENPDDLRRVILVYAVNKNNLAYDFKNDSREMLEAMKNVDLSKYQLLVFRTNSDSDCGLYRVSRPKGGEAEFTLVKSYPRDVPATDPDRIREVIDEALSLYKNAAYDLILWGHGMSWKPYFTNHTIVTPPMSYGYGGEYNPSNSNTDWTEIDELANAIPDHTFNTIWFDCCYMTGIEVIYQFRNKCTTFVGYPTEVYSDGMPYEIVLPYLISETPDVTGAAQDFFNSFNDKGYPVTVAVVDMRNIEPVASTCREIVVAGDLRPESKNLINYSRTYSSPFYDFREFFEETANLNNRSDLAGRLRDDVSRAVVYSAAADKDFNLHTWDPERISGLSTHYYKGSSSADEEYYRSLDWFVRVYL